VHVGRGRLAEDGTQVEEVLLVRGPLGQVGGLPLGDERGRGHGRPSEGSGECTRRRRPGNRVAAWGTGRDPADRGTTGRTPTWLLTLLAARPIISTRIHSRRTAMLPPPPLHRRPHSGRGACAQFVAEVPDTGF